MKTCFSYDQIEKALNEKLSEQNSIHDSKVLQIFTQTNEEEWKKKEDETEDDQKIRRGVPEQDIEALMKEFKCEEQIPKIKEHAIDKKLFWELDEGQLESLLEIKVFGRRKKLFKKIEQLKMDHNE